MPGAGGVLPMAVVGIDTVLGFLGREDQLVAAEELGEGGSVLTHRVPSLLDFLRVAEDEAGPAGGQVKGRGGDLRHGAARVGGHHAGEEPRAGRWCQRYQSGAEEASLRDPAESRASGVGVGAVLEVVQQVEQEQGVAVPAPYLEEPLHRVTPGQHHLPVGIGQGRSPGDETVGDRVAVRKAVLQQEVVDDVGRGRLVQHAFGTYCF
ncbi:hypothetical protein [Streptomyces sp. A0958]|uniref:hypothetical protein n=1 Tax=Streptomyces sp. A0958 TaxID=2563101 RepID=UPI001F10F625|nr:hypothetical protein [Streptomyces sp. A0958]